MSRPAWFHPWRLILLVFSSWATRIPENWCYRFHPRPRRRSCPRSRPPSDFGLEFKFSKWNDVLYFWLWCGAKHQRQFKFESQKHRKLSNFKIFCVFLKNMLRTGLVYLKILSFLSFAILALFLCLLALFWLIFSVAGIRTQGNSNVRSDFEAWIWPLGHSATRFHFKGNVTCLACALTLLVTVTVTTY